MNAAAHDDLGLGIFGCGVIGTRRARAAKGLFTLRGVFDIDRARAEALAAELGCEAYPSAEALLDDGAVTAVVVATQNHALADLTRAAMVRGKHVLVEKPVACSSAEVDALLSLSRERPQVRVKVGFNHRVHPAILAARRILDEENHGPILYLRARYGHGGRLGYDREWRADPRLAGGGELIDQGVHLIDLARLFLGELRLHASITGTFFWDMPVDDNAFLLLEDAHGRVAQCHVSCTEWKNLFCFELYLERAKLQIDGLGGSYGPETLTVYRMLPQMGPPPVEVLSFPEDRSWRIELEQLAAAIRDDRPLDGGLEDARAALRIVEEAYRAGVRRRTVTDHRRVAHVS